MDDTKLKNFLSDLVKVCKHHGIAFEEAKFSYLLSVNQLGSMTIEKAGNTLKVMNSPKKYLAEKK